MTDTPTSFSVVESVTLLLAPLSAKDRNTLLATLLGASIGALPSMQRDDEEREAIALVRHAIRNEIASAEKD